MHSYELTPEQAEQFLEHVVAREPYHLRELASWLDQTGGPLDEMDASVASLVPLWEWTLDMARAEFLGLIDGLVPAEPPPPDLAARDPEVYQRVTVSRLTGDRLLHYLGLVVRRLHPSAHWGLYRSPLGAREQNHQEVGLRLPGVASPQGGDWPVWVHDVRLSLGIALREDLNNHDRLVKLLAQALPSGLVPPVQERQPSVLRAYLDAALPPMPEVVSTSPAVAWQNARQPVPVLRARAREHATWEETVLAKGPGDGLDDPGLLDPLPEVRVLAALHEGGFVDLTVDDLLGRVDRTHPDGVAHLMTSAHGGRLRALHLDPVDPDEASWERIIAPLRMLAAELGATLVAEGEYPD